MDQDLDSFSEETCEFEGWADAQDEGDAIAEDRRDHELGISGCIAHAESSPDEERSRCKQWPHRFFLFPVFTGEIVKGIFVRDFCLESFLSKIFLILDRIFSIELSIGIYLIGTIFKVFSPGISPWGF